MPSVWAAPGNSLPLASHLIAPQSKESAGKWPACVRTSAGSNMSFPEAVQEAVDGADDQAIAGDRGAGEDALAEFQGLHLGPLGQVEHVEVAVRRADVDAVAGDDRRAIDAPLGGEGPDDRPLLAVEGVDALVAIADDDEL